jgi:serine protease Do
VDGKVVATSADLPRLITAIRPGTKATLDVVRQESHKQIGVVLGEFPEEKAQGRTPRKLKDDAPKSAPNKYGLVLSDIDGQQKKQDNENHGVLVSNVQGAALKAGIQRGDIILAVNNEDVNSVKEFDQIVNKVDANRNIALLVRRGDRTLYVALKAKEK